MNCSVLSSQSMIITTAMAVSGAVIFLSFSRIKNLPSIYRLPINRNPSLRSCLSSDRLKGEGKNKKKKRVKFADNVKEEKGEINNLKKKSKKGVFTAVKKVGEFQGMPANRAALYNGILRDRVHRIESY